jgi:hypothetical protein
LWKELASLLAELLEELVELVLVPEELLVYSFLVL